MEAAISVKHLNFFYAKNQVLFDINVDIAKHEVTGLIGPSGSGKSTLLRSFNRIYDLHPHQEAEGEIIVEGTSILAKKTNLMWLRSKVGMVFQKPTPFAMSVYDNIAFALRTHKKVTKEEEMVLIQKVLEEVSLWDEVKDKLRTSAFNLSGGQQQRLCIARTLIIEPSIILLDEPTSSLDPASTQKVEELIKRLREKYTIVLVTHNLNQARRLADKTMFLKAGHLIEYAATEALFTNPQDPLTKEYIEYA
jgi:phosphate transport system ATP-binding protein